MRVATKDVFHYVFCNKCESLSISEIPKNLGKFYEGYYSFGPVQDYESKFRKFAKKHFIYSPSFMKALFSKCLSSSNDLSFKSIDFDKINTHSMILDVGCGTGQLVFDLTNLGFSNAFGIDPFLNESIEYANGCSVLKKSIFEMKGSWDLIMVHHVFEHMEFQQDVLTQLASLISENGTILIRIPNIDSYAFRKYQENWYGVQPPVHLALPSINAMKTMISKAELDLVDIKGENIMEFWYHSLAYSLNIWDYSKYGIRTHMKNHSLRAKPKIVSKQMKKAFSSLNRRIVNTPELCDWVCFYLKKGV